MVLLDVGNEVRVDVAQEVQPVLMQLRGVVWVLLAWYIALLTLYYLISLLVSLFVSIGESGVLE